MRIFSGNRRTPDNKTIIIPNAKITGDNITNYTKKENRRVDLVIGVAYRDNIVKVKRVVADVLKGDECVLADPPPTIAVQELGDSTGIGQFLGKQAEDVGKSVRGEGAGETRGNGSRGDQGSRR